MRDGFAVLLAALWCVDETNVLPLFLLAGLVLLPLLPESIYNRILSSFNTSDTSISSRFSS